MAKRDDEKSKTVGDVLPEMPDVRTLCGSWEAYLARMGLTQEEYDQRLAKEREEEWRARAFERLKACEVRISAQMAQAIIWKRLRDTVALSTVYAWLDVVHGRVPPRKDGRVPSVLLLCGALGVGKTVACAYAIAEEGGSYTVAMHLPDRVNPRVWSEKTKPLSGNLVVVDDVGTEPGEMASSVEASLFDVIDRRMGQRRALTLITSNLSPQAFQEHYDPRLIDRLRDCGQYVPLHGESMRGHGGLRVVH
jgi:hypothetical protein